MNGTILQQWLERLGAGASGSLSNGYFLHGTLFLLAVLLAGLSYLLLQATVVRAIKKMATRTQVQWDDKLVESGIYNWLAHIAPLLILKWVGGAELRGIAWFEMLYQVYFLVVVLAVLNAALKSLQTILVDTQLRTLPLNGLIQALKLLLYCVGAILLLSVVLGRSPVFFFSGLTALSAVMMLIFKDSILGFVAGIQIAVNQMVQIGDWIEMPSQGANGFVTDVCLTTVKVQNWDKTISTIPTYALISESFKNWRGMSESGGRRIKRAIYIDMQTVRFADEAMLAQWHKLRLLQPYLAEKLKEIEADNAKLGEALHVLGNGRRLTNIGTFRAYCVAYLRANPHISQSMTFLVRQLQPTENGLPLEIYVFTNDTRWVAYENIQSDIFDHVLAMLPQFGLRVFQTPSGGDLHDVFGARGRFTGQTAKSPGIPESTEI